MWSQKKEKRGRIWNTFNNLNRALAESTHQMCLKFFILDKSGDVMLFTEEGPKT